MDSLVEAVVIDDVDPEGLGRVQVRYQRASGETLSPWARVLCRQAAEDRGDLVLPAVETEVLVALPDGDDAGPVVLGALHSQLRPPPYGNEDGENALSVWRFDTIELVADRRDGSLVIRDGEGRLHVRVGADGKVAVLAAAEITVETSGAVEIRAEDLSVHAEGKLEVEAGSVAIHATRSLDLSAGSALTVTAPTIGLNAP